METDGMVGMEIELEFSWLVTCAESVNTDNKSAPAMEHRRRRSEA